MTDGMAAYAGPHPSHNDRTRATPPTPILWGLEMIGYSTGSPWCCDASHSLFPIRDHLFGGLFGCSHNCRPAIMMFAQFLGLKKGGSSKSGSDFHVTE